MMTKLFALFLAAIPTLALAASPAVVTTSSYHDTSVVTHRNVTLPTGRVVGNTLLAILEVDAVPTLPTGWTLLDNQTPREYFFEKVIDGTEGATVLVNTSGADPNGTAIAASTYQISGASGTITFGTVNLGQHAMSTGPITIDPPAVTVSGGPDVLAIAVAGGIGVRVNGTVKAPQNNVSAPSGYTDGFLSAVQAGGGSWIASAVKQITGATTVDPGTFTVGKKSDYAWSQTVVVNGL